VSLSILNGDDSQDEVSARLQGVIIDFQPVPSNPQGDAGIDGFSHHGERAYGCYGPEQDAFKKNKDREKAIVDKFKEDLLRIFGAVSAELCEQVKRNRKNQSRHDHHRFHNGARFEWHLRR
jgi:hypothetical protein